MVVCTMVAGVATLREKWLLAAFFQFPNRSFTDLCSKNLEDSCSELGSNCQRPWASVKQWETTLEARFSLILSLLESWKDTSNAT